MPVVKQSEELAREIARYCENRFTDEADNGSFESVVDGVRELLRASEPHSTEIEDEAALDKAVSDIAVIVNELIALNTKRPHVSAYVITRHSIDAAKIADVLREYERKVRR